MDAIVNEEVRMADGDMNNNPLFHSNTMTDGTGSHDSKDCSDFIRGFIDCARESIQFLTDEGGMSNEHPFIKDLQSGLLKQIEILKIQLLLKEVIELGSEEGEADTDSESCDNSEEPASTHRTANLDSEHSKESRYCLLSSQELENETKHANKIVCHHGMENEESEISDDGFHEH